MESKVITMSRSNEVKDMSVPTLKDIYRNLSVEVPQVVENYWTVKWSGSYIDSSQSSGIIEFEWESHRLTVRFSLTEDLETVFDAAMDNEFPPKIFDSFSNLKEWVASKTKEIGKLV